MHIIKQADETIPIVDDDSTLCTIIAEAWGTEPIRKRMRTTDEEKREYELQMRNALQPLTTYLTTKGLQYTINILQGTVLIRNAPEHLINELYEHEPRIATTTRKIYKGENFAVVETLEATTEHI